MTDYGDAARRVIVDATHVHDRQRPGPSASVRAGVRKGVRGAAVAATGAVIGLGPALPASAGEDDLAGVFMPPPPDTTPPSPDAAPPPEVTPPPDDPPSDDTPPPADPVPESPPEQQGPSAGGPPTVEDPPPGSDGDPDPDGETPSPLVDTPRIPDQIVANGRPDTSPAPPPTDPGVALPRPPVLAPDVDLPRPDPVVAPQPDPDPDPDPTPPLGSGGVTTPILPSPTPAQGSLAVGSTDFSDDISDLEEALEADPAEMPQDGMRTWTVEAGDNLWEIVRAIAADDGVEVTTTDVAAAVAVLYRANVEVIGPDPDVLLVGAVLDVPGDLLATTVTTTEDV